MSAGIQNVHVRVNDAETGKPTAVRVRFVGPDGKYYAPFGRLTRFGTGPAEDVGGNLLLGEKRYAYIDGACEIRLPVGQIEVEIHKGPEYVPVHEKIELKKGKLSMRFEIRRWIDARSRGWYSGETHCYCYSPHGALLEAQGEDLAVVNLLAILIDLPGFDFADAPLSGSYARYAAISNILSFSGQQPALESPSHLVVVNTLNEHARLGRLALLNCHRPVFPLQLGLPGQTDDLNLADWCEQCHRKGGLVIGFDYLAIPEIRTNELLADIVLGHIDALGIELVGPRFPERLERWHDLLDTGFRIPIVAGSGKMANLWRLALSRTYVQIPSDREFNYKNWIEAMRAGKLFITDGPMLFFEIDGSGPGAEVEITQPNQPVRSRVEAASLSSFDRLELVYNREIVATAEVKNEDGKHVARIEAELECKDPGWLYARGFQSTADTSSPHLCALTAPVYITVAGQTSSPKVEIVNQFMDRLETVLQWVGEHDRFENENQRERMANVFLEAQEKLGRMLNDRA